MIQGLKVTALVPLEDNSEGAGRGNFLDFCGRPLFHHIIESLDRTYAVDEIAIDTDSAVVMKDAPSLSNKTKIIERPRELRGELVSTNRIFAHDLTQTNADVYVQTHATNPLLRPETVGKALKMFVDEQSAGRCDSLFSVSRYQRRFYHIDGTPVNHEPRTLIRTKNLSPILEENSMLYIFTRESFSTYGNRIGARPIMLETPRLESIDIVDAVTFKIAELLGFYTHRSSEDGRGHG